MPPWSRSPDVIVVDNDLVGDRVALAAQDEAARDLVVFEREVDVHVDFAFDKLGTAGRAHAALARVGQFDPLLERGVENVLLPFLERVLPLGAVDDHGYRALLLPWGRLLRHLVLVLGDARGEELDLHPRLREAPRLQRLQYRLHHSVGTADERRIDIVEIDPVCEQRLGLFWVDPSIEDGNILRLAAHYVDKIEPL